MRPLTSGLLLMIFGAFLVGGGISFRRQKLPLIAQVVLWILGAAFFAYGLYVVTLD